MTKPVLHSWLDTSHAVTAAERAVKVPLAKMPVPAQIVGADELLSEALAILTECALPPRDQAARVCAECGGTLELVRSGAKFCGSKCLTRNKVRRHRRGGGELPAAVPKGHVGSMHSWPEDQMQQYAVREVGMALCNWLRTRSGRSEIPSSQWLENADLAEGTSEPDAREVLEDYLVLHGVGFDGSESLEALAEAACWLQGDRAVNVEPLELDAA